MEMTYKFLANRVLSNTKRVTKLQRMKRLERFTKAEQYIRGDLAADKMPIPNKEIIMRAVCTVVEAI